VTTARAHRLARFVAITTLALAMSACQPNAPKEPTEPNEPTDPTVGQTTSPGDDDAGGNRALQNARDLQIALR
jgi:hypothetical protein